MTDATVRFPINTIQPGAYSAVDASALIDSERLVGGPVVAVLGDCLGGAPNTALRFTTQQALKSILRSGPALDCARAAMIGGASAVYVVRVGNGITAASKALTGATGTPVTLTARDAGTWTNQIKVTVAANNLVTIAYTDLNGVVWTQSFACGSGATAQDVADTINGRKSNIAASAWVTAAVTSGTMPLTVASQAAMTGGADTGSIVGGDWTTGLQALETKDVDFVEVATGDATVHAQALAHCNAMSSSTARKERTMVVGAVAGESVAQQVTRAGNLRDKRAQLIYPGVSLFDPTGALVAYPPYVAAAFVAGRHAALPDPATSLTHAVLAVLDVEVALSQIPGGDIDTLLAANVSPIAPAPGGGFWLVDSLSGYQADASLRDFHKTRTADASARRLRERLERKLVGGKALNGTADKIKREAIDELTDQVTEELLRDFREPSVDEDPNDPRTFLLTAPVMLPDTTKFILITLPLQPPSTAVAGSATNL